MTIIVTDELHYEPGKFLKVFNFSDGSTDPDELNVRGVIKDDKNDVVCMSFGNTPEVVTTDIDGLNNLIAPLVNDTTRFFASYEGTVLRVWYYEGLGWFLSTHRKLSAAKSKWGHDQTFKQLFDRALRVLNLNWDSFTATLDTNKIYVVLLRSFSENRKVCLGLPEPTLYLIGSFNRSQSFKFDFTRENDVLPGAEEITTIQTPDDLVSHVQMMDPRTYQGIVLLNEDGSSGKVVNPEYDRLDKIRNNEPNVLYRYVQLRFQPDLLSVFVALYPEHQAKFAAWDDVMSKVAHNILRKYIERYVNGRTAVLPPDQYPMLAQLHSMYKNQLRQAGLRVGTEHIWQIWSTWSERDLNVLYKKFNERQRLTGNGNRMPDDVRSGIIRSFNRASSAPHAAEADGVPHSPSTVKLKHIATITHHNTDVINGINEFVNDQRNFTYKLEQSKLTREDLEAIMAVRDEPACDNMQMNFSTTLLCKMERSKPEIDPSDARNFMYDREVFDDLKTKYGKPDDAPAE